MKAFIITLLSLFVQLALASLDKMDYVTGDCLRLTNRRQDICAADSIKNAGYVTSACMNLN